MRYVRARFENEMRETTYRIYVTDALKILVGADRRYYDAWAEDQKKKETRTSEEIIRDLSEKLRRLGGEDDGDNAS